MKHASEKHLVLFFTHDVSLQIWQDTGILEREIRPYQILAREQGWRISFITYGDDRDFAFQKTLDPIQILPAYAGRTIPSSKILRLFQSPCVLWHYRKTLSEAPVYKTNQFWGGWNAVFAKWLYGGKIIARGGYEYLAFAKAQKQGPARIILAWCVDWLLYRFSDSVVLATQDDIDFARRTFPFLRRKTVDLAPNWIDTTLFKPLPPAEFTLADCVYIGRLNAQKNLPALIEACAEQNISLDIYGSGECLETLKKQGEDRNAPVTFKDRIPNHHIPNLLRYYTVCVLPSHFEGNPKGLLEAMACGKAVLGTRVTGIRDIITTGENGLLCEPDPHAIGAGLKQLLTDEALQKTLGLKARETVMARNSLEHFIAQEQYRLLALRDAPAAHVIKVQMTWPPLTPAPCVSVVMSVHNAEKTVEDSVRSILAQTYKNFEFIIIEDGSTDSSRKLLVRLAQEDNRIKLILQENTGLTVALNRACTFVNGSLIARHDADDYALPDRFSLQVQAFLDDPALLLLGSNAMDLYPDHTEKPWGYHDEQAIQKIVRLCTPFPHATAMMRTEAFRQLGGYDESYQTAQDTELWMRFAKAGKIAMLPQPLIRRSVHHAAISHTRRFRQFRDALRARMAHYHGSKIHVLYFSVRGLCISLLPFGLVQWIKTHVR